MRFFQDVKDRIGLTWLVVILSLILIYFSYHLLMGDHGWIGYQAFQEDLKTAQVELALLSEKEERLLYKINLLKTPIDPDILEELAGKRLEYFHPQNKVIIPSS